jgi:hypothetical protein
MIEHFYTITSNVKGYYVGIKAAATAEDGTVHMLRHDFEHQANDGIAFSAPTGQAYNLFSNDVYGATKLDYV